MPRTARMAANGVIHHVLFRGIERRDIFLDAHDRASFCDRLSRLLVETGINCHAWALMTNHGHPDIKGHRGFPGQVTAGILGLMGGGTGEARALRVDDATVGRFIQRR